MFVDNVAQEWFKLGPDDFSISTWCGCSTPVKMICAWLYPILKLFIVFLFCKFLNKFLDLCLKIDKTQKLLIY